MLARLNVIVWTVVTLLGANVIRIAPSMLFPQAVASRKAATLTPGIGERLRITPYTLYFTDSRPTQPVSTNRLTVVKLVAARGDGSIVNRLESLGGLNAVSSRLLIFAAGDVITTNDIYELAHKPATKVDIRARHRDPASNCVRSLAGSVFRPGESVVGREVLFGYDTTIIKSSVSTSWVAPSLGCAELKLRTHDSAGTSVEQLATSIIPGEPASDLFAIPDSYKFVTREELIHR